MKPFSVEMACLLGIQNRDTSSVISHSNDFLLKGMITTTVATINGRLLNPSSTLMITNGNTTNPKLRTSLEMDRTVKIVQFPIRGYIESL